MKKTLLLMSVAFALGILVNSVDIKESKPQELHYPVPEAINHKDKKLADKGLILQDKEIFLDIFDFGYDFDRPLLTYRTVTNPITGERISGRLDSEGNIHDKKGVYKFQFIKIEGFPYDAAWYYKKNK